jgi:hypothetical protein
LLSVKFRANPWLNRFFKGKCEMLLAFLRSLALADFVEYRHMVGDLTTLVAHQLDGKPLGVKLAALAAVTDFTTLIAGGKQRFPDLNIKDIGIGVGNHRVLWFMYASLGKQWKP